MKIGPVLRAPPSGRAYRHPPALRRASPRTAPTASGRNGSRSRRSSPPPEWHDDAYLSLIDMAIEDEIREPGPFSVGLICGTEFRCSELNWRNCRRTGERWLQLSGTYMIRRPSSDRYEMLCADNIEVPLSRLSWVSKAINSQRDDKGVAVALAHEEANRGAG